MLRTGLGGLLLCVMSLAAQAARIELVMPAPSDDYWSHIRLIVAGELQKGDASKLSKLLPVAKSRAGPDERDGLLGPTAVVGVDSPGGDVDEAMRMGRLLRQHSATLLVRSGGECQSACILLLAGAVTKIPMGVPPYGTTKIGIHRIRPAGSAVLSQSSSDAVKAYNLMRAKVEDYLREMGASPLLADMMFKVGSEDMKLLNDSDLSNLNLTGMDPGYAEYVRAREIEAYGREWVQAKDEFFRCMNAGGRDEDCRRRTGFK